MLTLFESRNHITVFEHETLRIDRGDKRLTKSQLDSLQLFYGEKGVSYYSLIHHGVRFNEFVGVIRVGSLTIEVLPKADKSGTDESWRNVLIGMLRAVGVFNIHAPSSSLLRLKSNSILELYFELYINELEFLIHSGLVKKYRKTEGNTTALKGSILFAKHIQRNLVHKERFYVRHTIYDRDHLIHEVLYKALQLLIRINTNQALRSRIGALLLNFPEMKDINVREATFEKIKLDRKTADYRSALDIAKLLLLNYHPDVSKGRVDVLALMFDMNLLWEQFVYVSLRKHKPNQTSITAQNIKNFWMPESGNKSRMKPDIVLNKNKEDCIVLDTKWKNLNGYNPSPEDLRQLYVYSKYYQAKRVALIYPGDSNNVSSGKYFKEGKEELGQDECSIISLVVEPLIAEWQLNLSSCVLKWCEVN
ncbi:McrC family protein [Roseivirga sp.]|uniref:McrC family protein n=1 Tax=Roseivirga sp. TaxID=1964215 RepID=UPI003B8AA71E